MRRQTVRKENGRVAVPSVNRMPSHSVDWSVVSSTGRRGAERVPSIKEVMRRMDSAVLSAALSPKSRGNGSDKKPAAKAFAGRSETEGPMKNNGNGRAFSDDHGMPKDPLMADMEKGAREMEAMGMKRPGAGGW